MSVAGVKGLIGDLAQLLLAPGARTEITLFTVQGIRAVNTALQPHRAFLEHMRASAKADGDVPPTVEEILEKIAVRATEAASTAVTAPGVTGGAGTLVAGGTGTASRLQQAITIAASKSPNADILLWVEAQMKKKNHNSTRVHGILFVAKNDKHPEWNSTGFLHALAWGNVNAGNISHHLAYIYDYSTDWHIGVYFAEKLTSAALRAGLITEEHKKLLLGFSLEKLAKAARNDNWLVDSTWSTMATSPSRRRSPGSPTARRPPRSPRR